jgi:hypothetical protein
MISNLAELPSAIQEAAAGDRGGFLYFLTRARALAFRTALS